MLHRYKMSGSEKCFKERLGGKTLQEIGEYYGYYARMGSPA